MIMNEKERVESLLAIGDFSSNSYYEVMLVIRYLINVKKMCIKEEIIEKTKKILEEKMVDYFEWEWEDRIESFVKIELKNQTPITNINAIYVTQEEVDEIRKLPSLYQRKLLFTLMMYARFSSIKKGEVREWVGAKQEDIFKSANLDKLTVAQQDYIVADLIDLGKVTYNRKVSNLNLKVNCLHNDGNIVHWVNSFEDMGNLIEDYINFNYNKYKKCEVCGKLYKPKSNRAIYCPSCAKEVIKERDRLRKTKKN